MVAAARQFAVVRRLTCARVTPRAVVVVSDIVVVAAMVAAKVLVTARAVDERAATAALVAPAARAKLVTVVVAAAEVEAYWAVFVIVTDAVERTAVVAILAAPNVLLPNAAVAVALHLRVAKALKLATPARLTWLQYRKAHKPNRFDMTASLASRDSCVARTIE